MANRTYPQQLPINPIYAQLGVRQVIHAAGTKTSHGGNRLHPAVLQAMAQASESFVSVTELNRKVGNYIASVTEAEAGMVTNGAASGVVLSIAACMTGADIPRMRRLPDTTGMKNELVIHKIHRGNYSYMYTFAGAKLVEIGNMNECLPEELEATITDRTAAVAYLAAPRIPRVGLSLCETVKIAHSKGVPVIVDAASMLPPKSNLSRFIREGADLVVMSGGKMINGPQDTGLLFGRRDLVEAALACVNPNHGIGRPHKVSREDMVGLYTALQLYMQSDEQQTLAAYRNSLQPIIDALEGIHGIAATIEHDNHYYYVPTVVVRFTSDWQGRSGSDLARALLDGEPSIFLQFFADVGHLTVNPMSLQKGEPEIVAQRLREELERDSGQGSSHS